MGSRQRNTLCKVWSRDSQSDIHKKEIMTSYEKKPCFCDKMEKSSQGNQVDNQTWFDATVEPRLSGFLDHPDFFSNPIFS